MTGESLVKKYSLLYNREQIENREKIWKRGEVMFDIQEELKKLPQKPGVYLMKDENGHIIYVGKAVNLKNRVRQYFQSSRNHSSKIKKMVSHIAYFEYIITDKILKISDERNHFHTSLILSILLQIPNWKRWFWSAT